MQSAAIIICTLFNYGAINNGRIDEYQNQYVLEQLTGSKMELKIPQDIEVLGTKLTWSRSVDHGVRFYSFDVMTKEYVHHFVDFDRLTGELTSEQSLYLCE